MDRLDEINIFKKFLQKNGISFEYFIKLNNDEYERCSAHRLFKDIKKPCEFINYAFTWSETKEGHDFWMKLDINWRKYYKNFIDIQLFYD